MQVLHLVHQYLPQSVGGTELYTRWLADGLSRCGHQVAVFYRRSAEGLGLAGREDENGVRVWAVTAGEVTPNNRFLTTFGQQHIVYAFDRVLAQLQPDLVHIQHLQGLPVALVKSIRQRGIPFIITLHDYWWGCANAQLLTNYSREVCQGPKAYLNCARCALARAGHSPLRPAIPPLAGLLAWRNRLLRRVMQDACQLIAPTKFARDWYAAHGAPTDRLRIIPHGLPVPNPKPRRTRQPDGTLRLAYIGGLSWQKGVHVLLEAFKDLEEGTELWIAGDESADPAYAARLRHLASARVRFLGKLNRAEVWDTLAQVDALMVPSLWYETFAFVISEAFALKVPVVASRLGSLIDRVQDGVDGLLVAPGEVAAWRQMLRRLREEPTLLPRLRAGIGPVHPIEAYVSQIEAIYRAVLA